MPSDRLRPEVIMPYSGSSSAVSNRAAGDGRIYTHRGEDQPVSPGRSQRNGPWGIEQNKGVNSEQECKAGGSLHTCLMMECNVMRCGGNTVHTDHRWSTRLQIGGNNPSTRCPPLRLMLMPA